MKGNHRVNHRPWCLKAAIGIVIFPLLFIGCRRLPPQPTVPPEPTVHQPASKIAPSSGVTHLAGMWEYDDGNIIHCLHLNQAGNGKYDWQGGHFVTTAVFGDKWEGFWLQTENDREGEFQLRLSKDGKKAEGQWWYTRIENDPAPLQPGGRFVLRHVPCCSGSGEINSTMNASRQSGIPAQPQKC